jgi:hypothetical protein
MAWNGQRNSPAKGEKIKQFRYAKRNTKPKSNVVASLLTSLGERSMLSKATWSWRLRRLATKQNCDGYVEQFEERKAEST